MITTLLGKSVKVLPDRNPDGQCIADRFGIDGKVGVVISEEAPTGELVSVTVQIGKTVWNLGTDRVRPVRGEA